MRLSTIEFNGYKRLDRATCNVDGHTIAFIGPNESGKSSVLTGLTWLTDDNRDDPALSLREQNRRTRPAPDALVVRARYRLDPDDIQALRGLNIDPSAPIDDKTVTELRQARKGEKPRPGSQFFKPLRQVVESVFDTFKGQLDLEHHHGKTPAGLATRVAQRVLALTAVIWHNDRTGAPVLRSLTAYDH